jgi:hypothetical protein
VLTPLAWLLGTTALVAGLTGTWSPCGFSMVDTLARGGTGRRGVVAIACATFGAGALVGGVVTFGSLSLVGEALEGAGAAVPVAVAIACAAALGEARGVRIVPQVRRQVPEPWRRVLPLPLAAWLYGILLGLGFTTFVLTLAVWALAGMCVALGDPALGLVIGLGFGIGRALPVVLLAPVARRPFGVRAVALMAERPQLLRALRLADAAGLAACAAAIAAGPAAAAGVVLASGSDPSASGGDLAWQAPDGTGRLKRAGRTVVLPGRDPAIGGRLLTWRRGSIVTIARRDVLASVLSLRVDGVDKLAISNRWLVYRIRGDLFARRLASPRHAIHVAGSSSGGQIGRPAINGDTVVFSATGVGGSRIVAVDLRRHRRRTLRRTRSSQFLNPSLLGRQLLYVSSSRCAQFLRVGASGGGREHFLAALPPIARHDAGHEPGHTEQGSEPGLCPNGVPPEASSLLWTTALAPRYAYVTVLRFTSSGLGSPRILRIRR